MTPLVAEGFEVLQSTKNISILLAAIQVLTALLLAFILLALLALLFTVNPDLKSERQALVTPVMKWIASVLMGESKLMWLLDIYIIGLFVTLLLAGGGVLVRYYYVRKAPAELQPDPNGQLDDSDGSKKGE